MSAPKQPVPAMFWLAARGVWAVKINGRRIQLGADRAEATARYRRLLADHLGADALDALPPSDTDRSVAGLLLYYRSKLRADMHPAHVWRITRAIELAVQECGSLDAARFGPRALLAVRRRIIDAGYALRTVNLMVRCLCTAWGWLTVEELVPPGSAHALREVPSCRPGEVRSPAPVLPVPDAHVEATLPHLGPIVRAMVEVQRLTGMRPGEVVAMTPGRVSTKPDQPVPLRPGFALAAQQVGDTLVWIYCPQKHKLTRRGLPRIIPLGPRAQAVLAPLLEGRAPDVPVFSPRENLLLGGMARVLEGKRSSRNPGMAYRVSSYAHAVQAACKRAGVPTWSPNQLRHALATRIVNSLGLDTAQAALGHTDSGTTLGYISHILTQAVRYHAGNG